MRHAEQKERYGLESLAGQPTLLTGYSPWGKKLREAGVHIMVLQLGKQGLNNARPVKKVNNGTTMVPILDGNLVHDALV